MMIEKGLCVQCKKTGINTEINLWIEDSMGRKVLKRSCGNHSKRQTREQKAFYNSMQILGNSFQNPMEWI